MTLSLERPGKSTERKTFHKPKETLSTTKYVYCATKLLSREHLENDCKGDPDEVNWQLVREVRVILETRRGAKEFVCCKFCHYPIGIWYTEMASLNFTSFTKHTKENICRFMNGTTEEERAEMAKELVSDYTQNKMRKFKHKEALEKVVTLNVCRE